MNKHAVDLSHFKIETSIGKGGFGKVNCVTHSRSNFLLAMKTLNKAACFEVKNGVAQVFKELEFLRDLNHPNICNAHYAFQDDDNLYLVMDLALGGDLKFQLGEQGKFSEDIARFLVASVTLALIYLHEKDVIHRDVKPANLLMKKDGHVMLTDFGLSTRASTAKRSDICGTDGYIGPECYDKNWEGPITAQDWFSVGVSLCMFVTGTKPFKTTAGLYRNQQGIDEGLSTLFSNPDISQPCKDLISNLLNPDPAKRLDGAGVKAHSFFEGFDWDGLEKGEMEALFYPDVSKKNVDHRISIMDLEEQLIGFNAFVPKVDKSKQHHFKGYEFNTKLSQEDVEYIGKQKLCCAIL